MYSSYVFIRPALLLARESAAAAAHAAEFNKRNTHLQTHRWTAASMYSDQIGSVLFPRANYSGG